MEVGEVVVVPFFSHQEDKYSGEPRWIIILEDFGDKYRIVPMTCQNHQANNYTKTKVLLKSSEEGKSMGLTCDALVIGDRAKEVSKVVMNKNFPNPGKCSEDLLDELLQLLN
jgi:hypothetical protein